MAVRQFTDSTGVSWEVFDVRRHTDRRETVSPRLRDGWLTFVSATMKLRLAGYPEGWLSLSDTELERLRLQAIPAPEAKFPLRFRDSDMVSVVTPVSNTATGIAERGSPVPMQERIREHARSARAAGTPAVEAMIQLKRLLASHGIDTASPDFKNARRIFVDTFYFG